MSHLADTYSGFINPCVRAHQNRYAFLDLLEVPKICIGRKRADFPKEIQENPGNIADWGPGDLGVGVGRFSIVNIIERITREFR